MDAKDVMTIKGETTAISWFLWNAFKSGVKIPHNGILLGYQRSKSSENIIINGILFSNLCNVIFNFKIKKQMTINSCVRSSFLRTLFTLLALRRQ